MQNNEYYTEPEGDKIAPEEEVDLGTFKSVKSLKEAYDCLRKTFTQNAMELAKLKKADVTAEPIQTDEVEPKTVKNGAKTQKNDEKQAQNSQNSEVLSSSDGQNVSDKVDATPDNIAKITDKADAPVNAKYDSDEWREMAQNFFFENPEAHEHISEIGRIIMQDKTVQNSAAPLDKAWIKVLKQLPRNGQVTNADLEQYILQNDEIKQKIINDYLKGLQVKRSAPKVISERVGTQMNATKSSRALTMAEAKELAKKILIK